MKRFYAALCLLALLALPVLARAQQTIVPKAQETIVPVTSPATAPVGTSVIAPLPLAPLATQVGQTIQNLVGTTTPAPAASAATPAPDNSEDNVGQITDTFATSLLNTVTESIDELKAHSGNWTLNTSALPDLIDWLNRQNSDPHRQILWSDIGNDLLIIVGVPLLCGIALSLLLLPLRLKLKRNAPDHLPGKVGMLISLFTLRMLPLFVFLGGALLLLDQNEPHRLPRFVIGNIIYALTLGYGIRQILRVVFAPTVAHLRLLSLTTESAFYACRWFTAYSQIIVYGYFFIDIAAALRVPANVITLFQNLFGVVLTIMTIIVIFQTRANVATLLRGENADDQQSFSIALRRWLAEHWHSLATLYLVIGLTVTLLGIDNGIAVMLRGTILTFGIFIGARLAFIALEIWAAPTSNNTTLIHRQILSFLLRPAIWFVAAIGIAATWGFHIQSLLATPSGQRIFASLISVGLTLFVLTVLYEMLNAAIDRHMNRRDKNSKLPVASARARTLLPMVRNSVFILFSVVTVLICLSAIGINIAPLLAGAGVLGVAIGFGSQTLVKDFLTGLFIVVENTIAVGDIVKIENFGGVVEALSIRTIRLRDTDGSLHILPFSEVSKITNMSKGFAYALVDIGVAYDSDLERVMTVLREVGGQLQEDAVFKRVILEPIEVMGVENLGDSSITIRARIRTRPGKQWDVRRLLLLRIKQRFDKENIEIPFPTVTHVTKAVTPSGSAEA